MGTCCPARASMLDCQRVIRLSWTGRWGKRHKCTTSGWPHSISAGQSVPARTISASIPSPSLPGSLLVQGSPIRSSYKILEPNSSSLRLVELHKISVCESALWNWFVIQNASVFKWFSVYYFWKCQILLCFDFRVKCRPSKNRSVKLLTTHTKTASIAIFVCVMLCTDWTQIVVNKALTISWCQYESSEFVRNFLDSLIRLVKIHKFDGCFSNRISHLATRQCQ